MPPRIHGKRSARRFALWPRATELFPDGGKIIDFAIENWSQRDTSRIRNRVF
jgi:hypothetical protein